MSKIKICGLMHTADADALNELVPDFAGFILSSTEGRFRRQITVAKADLLRSRLDHSIKTVGVFVDEALDFITEICEDEIIDLIQLHGDEDDDFILSLSRRVRQPIIKAVKAKSSEDILAAEGLHCHYLLLDTPYSDKPGGGGESFGWEIIPKSLSKPFFLAGGLGADNLQKALEEVNPYCVDISSSVETDGKKDRAKIEEVIKIVRRMNNV